MVALMWGLLVVKLGAILLHAACNKAASLVSYWSFNSTPFPTSPPSSDCGLWSITVTRDEEVQLDGSPLSLSTHLNTSATNYTAIQFDEALQDRYTRSERYASLSFDEQRFFTTPQPFGTDPHSAWPETAFATGEFATQWFSQDWNSTSLILKLHSPLLFLVIASLFFGLNWICCHLAWRGGASECWRKLLSSMAPFCPKPTIRTLYGNPARIVSSNSMCSFIEISDLLPAAVQSAIPYPAPTLSEEYDEIARKSQENEAFVQSLQGKVDARITELDLVNSRAVSALVNAAFKKLITLPSDLRGLNASAPNPDTSDDQTIAHADIMDMLTGIARAVSDAHFKDCKADVDKLTTVLSDAETRIGTSFDQKLSDAETRIGTHLDGKLSDAETRVGKNFDKKLTNAETRVGTGFDQKLADAEISLDKALSKKVSAADTSLDKAINVKLTRTATDLGIANGMKLDEIKDNLQRSNKDDLNKALQQIPAEIRQSVAATEGHLGQRIDARLDASLKTDAAKAEKDNAARMNTITRHITENVLPTVVKTSVDASQLNLDLRTTILEDASAGHSAKLNEIHGIALGNADTILECAEDISTVIAKNKAMNTVIDDIVEDYASFKRVSSEQASGRDELSAQLLERLTAMESTVSQLQTDLQTERESREQLSKDNTTLRQLLATLNSDSSAPKSASDNAAETPVDSKSNVGGPNQAWADTEVVEFPQFDLVVPIKAALKEEVVPEVVVAQEAEGSLEAEIAHENDTAPDTTTQTDVQETTRSLQHANPESAHETDNEPPTDEQSDGDHSPDNLNSGEHASTITLSSMTPLPPRRPPVEVFRRIYPLPGLVNGKVTKIGFTPFTTPKTSLAPTLTESAEVPNYGPAYVSKGHYIVEGDKDAPMRNGMANQERRNRNTGLYDSTEKYAKEFRAHQRKVSAQQGSLIGKDNHTAQRCRRRSLAGGESRPYLQAFPHKPIGWDYDRDLREAIKAEQDKVALLLQNVGTFVTTGSCSQLTSVASRTDFFITLGNISTEISEAFIKVHLQEFSMDLRALCDSPLDSLRSSLVAKCADLKTYTIPARNEPHVPRPTWVLPERRRANVLRYMAADPNIGAHRPKGPEDTIPDEIPTSVYCEDVSINTIISGISSVPFIVEDPYKTYMWRPHGPAIHAADPNSKTQMAKARRREERERRSKHSVQRIQTAVPPPMPVSITSPSPVQQQSIHVLPFSQEAVPPMPFFHTSQPPLQPSSTPFFPVNSTFPTPSASSNNTQPSLQQPSSTVIPFSFAPLQQSSNTVIPFSLAPLSPSGTRGVSRGGRSGSYTNSRGRGSGYGQSGVSRFDRHFHR